MPLITSVQLFFYDAVDNRAVFSYLMQSLSEHTSILVDFAH